MKGSTMETVNASANAPANVTTGIPGSSQGTNAGYPSYEYTTFPKKFVAYRWFKPLLTLVLTVVFMGIFQIIITLVAAGISHDPNYLYNTGLTYDDMDIYTLPGVLFNLGSIAAMLPALALAIRIVHARPFSSLTSSRGGWNWGLFAKCLLIAVIIFALPSIIGVIVAPDPDASGVIKLTVAGAVAIAVFGPLQCLSEEYIFRGYVMQTFGSWFKFPVIAIILQAIVFALLHGYNLLGNISIFISGVIFGILAWYSRGLEASSAAHIANNLTGFYIVALGFGTNASDVSVASFIMSIAFDAIFATAVILLGRKFHWFKSKGDGTLKFNTKMGPKYQAKAMRKAAKKSARTGQYVAPVIRDVPNLPPMPMPPAASAAQPMQVPQASQPAPVMQPGDVPAVRSPQVSAVPETNEGSATPQDQ